jgi:hypothetical protein
MSGAFGGGIDKLYALDDPEAESEGEIEAEPLKT